MTTLRCAILDDYQHAALAAADWASLSPDVEVRAIHHHLRTEDEVAAAVGDCQILVIMRERTAFPATLLARLRHLRLLVTTGPKNAAIDLVAARAQGVVVCGTSSAPAPPAELTWALLLALARNLVQEDAARRTNGPWQSSIGTDLAGSTLGLLGLGRIGARVARVARAFDMTVIAWSQNLTADRATAEGVRLATSKEQLLAASDFVSVHLILSSRTRGLLGEQELKRMRRSACLINTSRAGIVDQEAMLRALHEGWIAGAAVDVFEEEPLPTDHPLRSAPNLLATPHIGYVTRANYAAFYGEAVEDIHAFLSGAPIRLLT